MIIFAVASFIVFILVVLTAVVVLRQVIRPITKVTSSINELAAHNLSAVSVDVKNRDEIGDLANSNNELRSSMRTIVSELNSSTDMERN